jgi:hypothetical protein
MEITANGDLGQVRLVRVGPKFSWKWTNARTISREGKAAPSLKPHQIAALRWSRRLILVPTRRRIAAMRNESVEVRPSPTAAENIRTSGRSSRRCSSESSDHTLGIESRMFEKSRDAEDSRVALVASDAIPAE